MKTMYVIKNEECYIKGIIFGSIMDYCTRIKDAKVMDLKEAQKVLKHLKGNTQLIEVKTIKNQTS